MKRIVIIVVAIVVLIIIGAYYKKAKGNDTTKSNTSGSSSSSKASRLAQGTFPIKRGQKTMLVEQLQKELNKHLVKPLVVDGDYGPKTAKAALWVFSLKEGEKNEVTEQEFAGLKKGDFSKPGKDTPVIAPPPDLGKTMQEIFEEQQRKLREAQAL